jgi:cbb3-type cytochrome oxidase subunit 1
MHESQPHTSNTPIAYEMGVVRQFAIMTVIWGIVGMSRGGIYCRPASLARP